MLQTYFDRERHPIIHLQNLILVFLCTGAFRIIRFDFSSLFLLGKIEGLIPWTVN